MQPLNLAPSSVLKVFEYSDVDEFRSALDSPLIRIVPTQAGPISAMQAVLALPNCEIYLLRTFPRLVDLEIPADRTLVLFSMVGTSDTIINGQQLEHPSLILGRGPTDYRMVEGAQTCVAGIRFGRVCGPCRPIWRSTVDNSGSLAAAAIMKKWRNEPYSSLGLGPKPWFAKR